MIQNIVGATKITRYPETYQKKLKKVGIKSMFTVSIILEKFLD